MVGMCTAFEMLIPRFVNGELPIRDARRVELHLTMCDPCRKATNALRQQVDPPFNPPPVQAQDEEYSITTLRSRMAAQWNGELPEPVPADGFRKQWWLLAAGGVLLLIIGAVMTH